MKKLTILIAALSFIFAVGTVEAKGHGGGHHSSASHHSTKSTTTHQSTGSKVKKGGGSGGCGSKGGPGYRKANGKCAGWKG